MLTDEHINEIAELLECGMICYFHRTTGKIAFHPDPGNYYFEPELWQDTIDKVEKDWDNYEKFEKMDSKQEFIIMEKFSSSINDENFQNEILDRISKRRPFHNFKILIDSSDYRQDWFNFKKKAYIDWVKQQLE